MSETQQRYSGLKRLDDVVFYVNKPIIGRLGLHFQKLVRDWDLIVGNDIANYTIPIKIGSVSKNNIRENILYIATNNFSLAAELVYQISVIKEKINLYLGYSFIEQIKIIHEFFPHREVKIIQEEVKLNLENQAKLNVIINDYDIDDEIKDILIKLGSAVIANSSK